MSIGIYKINGIISNVSNTNCNLTYDLKGELIWQQKDRKMKVC